MVCLRASNKTVHLTDNNTDETNNLSLTKREIKLNTNAVKLAAINQSSRFKDIARTIANRSHETYI